MQSTKLKFETPQARDLIIEALVKYNQGVSEDFLLVPGVPSSSFDELILMTSDGHMELNCMTFLCHYFKYKHIP